MVVISLERFLGRYVYNNALQLILRQNKQNKTR
jgi:hypothetical protein